MPEHDNNSLSDVAANLHDDPEQSLIFERYLPAADIAEIWENFGYQFRERVYTPTITLRAIREDGRWIGGNQMGHGNQMGQTSLFRARSPRADEAGGLCHTLNRAKLGAEIFGKEEDFVAFEKVLREALHLFQVELYAYRTWEIIGIWCCVRCSMGKWVGSANGSVARTRCGTTPTVI